MLIVLIRRIFISARVYISVNKKAHDKMRSGADLNGDNLQISTTYLRISDHCRVTFRVRIMVRFGSGLGSGSGLELKVRVRVRFRVANCCIQTAGEATKCGSITSSKLTNGDAPRRSAPLRILSCPK